MLGCFVGEGRLLSWRHIEFETQRFEKQTLYSPPPDFVDSENETTQTNKTSTTQTQY
jgi:hypothetical protein